MSVQLVNDDCISYLRKMEGKVRCIFFHPPDFLEGYSRDRTEEYVSFNISWIRDVIKLAVEKCDIFWILVPNVCWAKVVSIAETYDNCVTKLKKFTWNFNSIEGNAEDFYDVSRTVLYIKNTGFIGNVHSIGEQTKGNRAGERVANINHLPSNQWIASKIRRGTSEYLPWCKDQCPIAIYNTILKYSCNKNDTFLDLTAGSGTCFRASRLIPSVNVIGVEANPDYCNKIIKHHKELQSDKETGILV